VEWGWRGRNFSRVISSRSSPTRGEETSSPQEARALPAHRHLGASSPSGNARGGCRGCNFLDWTKPQRNDRDNIFILNLYFCPPQISPKQKEEQMENSSPNPSFSIWDTIQKQMSRSFAKSSSYRSCTPFTF